MELLCGPTTNILHTSFAIFFSFSFFPSDSLTPQTYVTGADGISSGSSSATNLNFVAGSGEYSFQLSGSPSTVYCFNTTEHYDITLSCPTGQVVSSPTSPSTLLFFIFLIVFVVVLFCFFSLMVADYSSSVRLIWHTIRYVTVFLIFANFKISSINLQISGECGALRLGTCNAGSSVYVVENRCLLKNSCTMMISDMTFNEPCENTPKSFASQVLCGSI